MTIITFDRVSKLYRPTLLGSKSLREELARSVQKLVRAERGGLDETDEFFALRDVSFEVEQGETVGFIGPNGSGKSTILKLLAHITYPTRGRVTVLGSLASLIEVGAGFHPELSGRQNIYLYGSIMGMRQADVGRKFDRIVEFAELERFIDTPVKRYSSGMYVRLGFAVAAHINPQVLLIDEVLAVGDAAFKTKCLQRIEELRRGGMTIVFVSHDMSEVERLCNRAFFLDQGQIRSAGDPQSVIADYYDTVIFGKGLPTEGRARQRVDATQDRTQHGAEIVNVCFLNRLGKEIDTTATGEPFVARIEYRAHGPVDDAVFELLFYSPDDRLHCHFTTALTDECIPPLEGGGAIEIVSDELGLAPGIFRVDAAIARRGAVDSYDRKPRQYVLKVLPGKKVRGLFYSPHRWRLLPSSDGQPSVGPTPVLWLVETQPESTERLRSM